MESCSFSVNGSEIHFVNFLFPEAGSFILGIIRITVFTFFVFLNWKNAKRVQEQEECSMAHVKGLILPSYAEYFYLLIAANLLSGLFDIGTSFTQTSEAESINQWIIPLEMGIFHCLAEGFAIFLLRNGAGILAFHRALLYGGVWGMITAIIFFVEIRLLNTSKSQRAYELFFIYTLLLFVFYLILAFIPAKIMYRRPALVLYSRCNALFQGFLVIASILIYERQHWSICSSSALALLIVAILQPVVIYKTLQLDSQYWQGRVGGGLEGWLIRRLAGKDETIAAQVFGGIWDEVDMRTAASISAGLYEIEAQRNHIPILHFGHICLDSRMGFVSGGYSRVYFGKLKKEKVALKMIYAMELTSNDVSEFFREARMLHELQHPNIVKCSGICVMPPALTVVLEYCLFGSLFDFLHTYRTTATPSESETARESESQSYRFSLFSSQYRPKRNHTKVDSAKQREEVFRDLYRYSNTDLLRVTEFVRSSSSVSQLVQQRERDVLNQNQKQKRAAAKESHSLDSKLIEAQNKPSNTRIEITPPTQGSSASLFNNSHLYNANLATMGDDQNWTRASAVLPGSFMMDFSTLCSESRQMEQYDLNSRFSSALGQEDVAFDFSLDGMKLEQQVPRKEKMSNKQNSVKLGVLSEQGAGEQSAVDNIIHSRGNSDVSDIMHMIANNSNSSAYNKSCRNENDGDGDGGDRVSFVGRVRESFALMMNSAGMGFTTSTTPVQTAETRKIVPFGYCVPPTVRYRMMQECVRAVQFLHSKGYMHCDIKSLNFLVAKDLSIRLADFGATVPISESTKSTGVAIQARQWAPPEMLLTDSEGNLEYTQASDVYSLAIVLAEIVVLQLFHADCNEMSLNDWKKILIEDNMRPTLPSDLPANVKDAIEACWSTEPSKRLTSDRLLEILEEFVV